ncbi:MAG: hypothetical protein IKH54_03520 [Bacilli bacterium]|nr:hypothetical protein [Bacilli bacterium]
MSEKEMSANKEYETLKWMEYLEPDEYRRKDFSKLASTMEKDKHKISATELNDYNKNAEMNEMFENNEEDNKEITGGKTK